MRHWLVVLGTFGVLGCGESEQIWACGDGTTRQGDRCVRSLVCGDGTAAVDFVCVPEDEAVIVCDTGKMFEDGACVPIEPGEQVVCGRGTRLDEGECVLAEAPLACGEGTEAVDGECVLLEPGAQTSCGEGTMLEDDECVPTSELTCGPSTHEEGDLCVPDVICDEGMAPGVDGCVPSLECGEGTEELDGKCVSNSACGPGTYEEEGICLPVADGAHFELRSLGGEVPANGYSKVPLLGLGTDSEGAPLTETVIVYPSRVDAGTVEPSTFELGTFGTLTWFKPCNGNQNPGCLGDVQLLMTRASDVGPVVAASPTFTLVAPKGVGSTQACKLGGNVLHFDGASNDWVHPGEDIIQIGTWSGSISEGNLVAIHVVPKDAEEQGSWWDLTLTSRKLGVSLTENTYEEATRYPFESDGVPGMSISGDGRGCNTLKGSFQIETLSVASGSLLELTASFVQYCDGGGALHGCVHFEQ